jgi:TatD DNase family protein
MPAAYSTAFDAHTHLDDPAFDRDRDAVVQRAVDAGVTGIALAGADPGRWQRLLEIAVEHGLVAILGLHPWWVDTLDDDAIDAALARLPDLLTHHGLGELGLDRHRARDDAALARQRRVFHHQLALAIDRELPVVLHGVRAWAEVLRTLDDRGLPARGGMAHAWTGAPELVDRAVALGLHVSFGTDLGRSERARASVVRVPRHLLLLETDAPDRPLTGVRGEPADLRSIAALAAALRGEQGTDVLTYTGQNARRLFGVPEVT